ncbi:AAA family ATPase [Pseudohongiella sp. SYSU M77423]|uniref:gluconokinase n=1 Tax=Pseudohongiella sp. SYSU M77423 TaxID=3042312 RepID=UPI0024804FAC|nr:AAA family ATPase [Pseudohongiella sp. SYSU M77423]MDH7943946.1 AAA family ATPase [Pseudohongiella sp. SYSU M77423]
MQQAINGMTLPTVWFLFGLSGSGKSFAGDVLSRHYGWPVYHADDDITSAMREALNTAQPFTDAMRDEFFAVLLQTIRQRVSREPDKPLIVTQGAYKQRHRDWLQARLPQTRFVWVKSDPQLIVDRLRSRRDGISVASATALTNDFEAPGPTAEVLVNDGSADDILLQFQALLRG